MFTQTLHMFTEPLWTAVTQDSAEKRCHLWWRRKTHVAASGALQLVGIQERLDPWNQILRLTTRPPCCPVKCGREGFTVKYTNTSGGYSSSLAACFHCGTIRIQRKRNEKELTYVQMFSALCRMKDKTLGCMAVVSLWIFGDWNVYLLGGKTLHISLLCPRWEIDINAAASRYSCCVLR